MTRTLPRRGAVRVPLFLIVLVLGLGVGTRPSAAHTELESSAPARGTTVDRLPRVILRFEGTVDAAQSHIWIERGTEMLPLGPVRHLGGDGTVLVAPVPEIRRGGYTIGWHVVSEDGDPVTGAVPFTLARGPVRSRTPVLDAGADEPAPPASAPEVAAGPSVSAGSARLLRAAGVSAFLGGVLVLLVAVVPRRSRASQTPPG